ncbi:MAG: disulfide bond formation protein B [Burkholderiales bacterium]|nr:MAG: disulfide bond formation protein B [Burkholderiales bacterium]
MLLSFLDAWPRRVLALVSLVCVGLLAFGLYLQHSLGLEPCPMCIVQRYALVLVAIITALSAIAGRGRGVLLTGAGLAMLLAAGGAFTAARQSWLQWYPPESASCGRDLYGMIETFPLQRVIPMIFRGSGDCTKIDWTFLGGSIANWSFVWFILVILVLATLLVRQLGRR